MARPPFSCHADNGRCGCVDFEATATTAPTSNPAEGFYAHVANFSGRVIDAPPKLAIQNDAATDARAQRNAHNRAMSPRRALPHLSDCRCVRVILNNNRPAQYVPKRWS